MGVFSRRTNRTQEVWVYSHDGPIIRRKRGYILTTDQSYAGSMGIFSRRTNRTQEVWVYSHVGPIARRKYGYILTTDQSYASKYFVHSAETCFCGFASTFITPFCGGAARVYSHHGPIIRRKFGHILMTDQSYASKPRVKFSGGKRPY
eukprot:1178594-Prorocentrum_minimum.AAC.1